MLAGVELRRLLAASRMFKQSRALVLESQVTAFWVYEVITNAILLNLLLFNLVNVSPVVFLFLEVVTSVPITD